MSTARSTNSDRKGIAKPPLHRSLLSVIGRTWEALFSSEPSHRLDLQVLEDRVLYSATPMPVDAGAVESVAASMEAVEATLASVEAKEVELWEVAPQERQAIFIDSSLDDLDALLHQLIQEEPSTDVFLLETDVNGLSFITDVLAQTEVEYSSIHIVTHGSQGAIQLGNAFLTSANVESYQADFANWAEHLTDDADILFYGCDVAQSVEGQSLLTTISALTQADVSASVDVTGHEALGGDWDLEFFVGTIEAEVAFSAEAQSVWMGTLDITTGLVAHYEFDEGSGATAGDSSANSNDGTLVDSPTWTTGHVGSHALDLNGNFDRVEVADNAALDFGTGDFSVSFWFNSTQTPSSAARILGQSSGSDGFLFYTDDFGDLNFLVEGTTNNIVLVESGLLDGNWHHVTGLRSGGSFQLYVDGTLRDSGSASVGNTNSSEDFRIGSSTASSNEYDGLVDDVRLYNRALSSEDIGLLHSLSITGPLGPTDIVFDKPNLVVNGSFESPELSSSSGTFPSITGWTPVNATRIEVHELFNGLLASDGDQWVELDYIAAGGQGIRQDITTTAGTTYDLSFDVARRVGSGAGTNDVEVYWNGSLLATISPAAEAWERHTFSVVGTGGADQLEFREPATDLDSAGSYLDNVSLTERVTVGETSGNGTVVADVTQVTDPTPGDSHTFSLTDNAGGRFAINASSGEITIANAGLVDFESATSHTVTVRATDLAGNTYDEVLRIDVTAVDESPVNSVPGPQSVREDVTLVFDAANANLISIFDDAGTTSTVTLSVNYGTLTLSQTTGLSFSSGGNGTSAMTFSGSLADVNAALDGLSYNANAGFGGADTLTIVSDDSSTTPDTDNIAITVDALPAIALLSDDAVAAYDFESGTDSIAAGGPAISVSPPVTISSSAGFTTGPNGLLFTGEADSSLQAVSIGALPAVTSSGEFSFAARVRFDAGSGDRHWERIFDFGGGASDNNFLLGRFQSTNDLQLEVFSGGVREGTITISDALVGVEGTWMHLGATVDSTGLAQLFINGTRVGSVQASGAPDFSAWTSNLIGISNWGASDKRFQGAIDDIGVFDRVLTESEFASLANTATPQTFSVAENAVNTTSVGFVHGGDSGGGALTYSLTDNAGGRFTINTSTGEITVANGALLDFETSASHNIAVQVSDTAGGTDTEILTIAVSDVETPVENHVPAGQNVAEDTTLTFNVAGSNPISISADAGSHMTITLAVDHGSLHLSQTTGLTIVAGADGSATVTVSGSVDNINAALDGLQYTPDTDFHGSDSLAIWSMDQTLYQLNLDSNLQARYEFESSNPTEDTGPGAPNNGALVGNASVVQDGQRGDVLHLDGTGDALTAPGLTAMPGSVTLAAWFNASESGTFIAIGNSFGINVGDTGNDLFGFHNSSSGYFQTNYNSTSLIGAGWHHAAFVIDDLNNTQSLYLDGVLVAQSFDAGTLDYSSGTSIEVGRNSENSLYDFGGRVDEARVYDRTLTEEEIVALATDLSHGQDADTIPISVTSVNDSPVVAVNSGTTVLEGSTGNVITSAMLNEGDVDDAGAGLTYTITSATSNGTLFLNGFGSLGLNDTFTQADVDAGLLSYDHSGSETTADSFSFQLADGGEDGATPATGTFNISVTLVNDNSVSAIVDNNASPDSVPENAAVSTPVGIVAFANDPDIGDTVTYSLDDDDAGRFAIDSVSGLVTVAGAIDRESDGASRNIVVRATSSDGSLTTQSFSIAVEDVDEFDVAPVVDGDATTNGVQENASVGTSVGITAQSSDSDATNNTITYSLDDNDGGRFAIDSSTGEVTVAGAIDREADGASRSIVVRATSSDGSLTTQSFSITVEDVDEFDAVPVVDGDAAANGVQENASVGTSVGITAQSSDSDATNNTITYSLDDNDGGRFTIDSSTGEVTVAGAIDREAGGASRSIVVRATSSDGSLTTQSFSIAVEDVDEFDAAPVVDGDATTNGVQENASVGTSVGITAQSSDSDATNNTITYSLDDDDGGRFAIDSSTGEVTVAGAIDREADGASRSVVVRATSSDGSLTTQSFSIAVEDVDEFDAAPLVDGDSAANGVQENASVGTSVGITAQSSDSDATNNTITYSLDDDDGGRFAIDSSTGEVTVAGAIDHEADGPQRNITVRATSADGSSSVMSLAISIENVDEAPVSDADVYSTAYINNLVVDVASGVLANDLSPDGKTLSVVLVSGPASGQLLLASDGSLFYQPEPGYVGQTSFEYFATDGSLSSAVQTVTIVVFMPDELPTPEPENGPDEEPEEEVQEEETSDSEPEGEELSGDVSVPLVANASPEVISPASNVNAPSTVIPLAGPKEDAAESETGDPKTGPQERENLRFATFGEAFEAGDLESSDFRRLGEGYRSVLEGNQEFFTTFAELERQVEGRLENEFLYEVEPIVTTVVGAGVVIWAVSAGQVATILLSTASTWGHFDPLVVLQGLNVAEEAETVEELLFEDASVHNTDAPADQES